MRNVPSGNLVLIRHGETAWSLSGQHTGLTDIPLTPRGERLGRRLPEQLGGFDLGLVLTSPLQRARQTAALAGLAAQPDPDLVEWDYGGYEGVTTEEIRERVGYDWEIFADGVVAGTTRGETLQEVAARCRRVLDRVAPALQQGDVALFSHGHTLRVLTSVFLGWAPQTGAQLALEAGAVSVLGYERELPAIQSWNRVLH
ncbi:MAG TPA: histidine phosphatase family protein [Dermatophilaceae bacterium]|nr:histidine phosphatase family protein [Dermatophilaceae bacterium]